MTIADWTAYGSAWLALTITGVTCETCEDGAYTAPDDGTIDVGGEA